MDVGTYLPDPESEQIWVGCPLRVHRRCDEPMFSISNHIAYDGLMVHGKKPGLVDFPESGWLDVKGRTCEGNWVVEEGAAVEKLLLALRHQYSLTPDDVFLISPFRDCAKQLNRIAKRLGFRMDRTGTVHKTQGKEAAVVILVLGGNIKSQGAKAWAAENPTMPTTRRPNHSFEGTNLPVSIIATIFCHTGLEPRALARINAKAGVARM